MLRPQRIVVARGPLGFGILASLFFIAVGVFGIAAFFILFSEWRMGNPPPTGIKNYGPYGLLLLAVFVPVCVIIAGRGVLELLRATGVIARVYARPIGDELVVGSLGSVLLGRGVRLGFGEGLTLSSSRVNRNRRAQHEVLWPDRWVIRSGDSRFHFRATLPVTSQHRAQAKRRIDAIWDSRKS